jgi:hypothetical protein
VVFACERIFARTLFFYWVIARRSNILRAQRKGRGWFRELRFVAGKARKFAQVGEWLKPTDCKSVPPCEVRRFESFPVHQELAVICGRERSGSPQPKSRAKRGIW